MAGAKARPRLGHLALIAFIGARIDHLFGPACEIFGQLPHAARAPCIERRAERGRLRRHLALLDLAAFRDPFFQAAIEHAHVVVAEGQEHPPRAGRRDPTAGIVDHDRVVIADPEPADIASELFGRREHVRQRVGMVRHRVDVEKHRARNMRREIVVFRQRQHARHLERRIDHLDVWIGDVRGEPVGGNKRIVG